MRDVVPWLGGELFAVTVDGQLITGSAMAAAESVASCGTPQGRLLRTRHPASGLQVDRHALVHEDGTVVEVWLTVCNAGSEPVTVDRVDSFSLDLPAGDYVVSSFTGDGDGNEFAPFSQKLAGSYRLETLSGRSSHGTHPWFALSDAAGGVLVGTVAWSGNWVMRFEELTGGGYRVGGGLHDEGFAKSLAPGEELESPRVVLAREETGDVDVVAARFARIGREHWYPPVGGDFPPVQWNHWWPYADRHIDEATFRANVDAGIELGVEAFLLDAGWFGPAEVDSDWVQLRGDWDRVNTARFPGGIRALADHTHAKGAKFGIWCEIDGLGAAARLRSTHPEFAATRGGEFLGYVCFANPEVRAWARQTLQRLVTEYRADWIKFDSNITPGLGCDRTDHGHQAGDGLFEHYLGYYALLDQLREDHPDLILENCASGGLRTDLGIARRTHLTYLSDPDWPEHSLCCFWGASTILAPDRCLHWSYSHWWEPGANPHMLYSPTDPGLTAAKLDYYTRISMLHAFGLGQKLPELPAWIADRYREHIRLYKDVVRRFVRQARMLRLTGQVERDGRGERWAAFQYAMEDDAEHLLFVFRLDGGEKEHTIQLRGLLPKRRYTVAPVDGGAAETRTGAELTENGLRFTDLAEEDSALLLIRPADDGAEVS
ncbi:MAG: alpha-galactosidase [Micromonosporaceae bacterium]|nr:alpha-galactosidase [Micromonosporaceae bacterium]